MISQSIDIASVTDWYIPADDGGVVVTYPNGEIASGAVAEFAETIRQAVIWKKSQEPDVTDFRLEVQSQYLRIHIQRNVDGTMFMCRNAMSTVPAITHIGLPGDLESILMSERLGRAGGLLLIAGGNGVGKSTTLASLIKARVQKFGSFCLTVEDPPEFAMEGNYPVEAGRHGKIVQVQVEDDDFAGAIRSAMRCYPSSIGGNILMIGEVRDSRTAAELLRASANGLLVCATMHAVDQVSAVARIISMAEGLMGAAESRAVMAHSLRLVMHQRKEKGRISVDPLIVTSPVRTLIRSGDLHQMSTAISHQATMRNRGRLFELFCEE